MSVAQSTGSKMQESYRASVIQEAYTGSQWLSFVQTDLQPELCFQGCWEAHWCQICRSRSRHCYTACITAGLPWLPPQSAFLIILWLAPLIKVIISDERWCLIYLPHSIKVLVVNFDRKQNWQCVIRPRNSLIWEFSY